MEELKKLYPFTFLPIAETFGWGGRRLAEKYAKPFVECDDQGNEKLLSGDRPVAESHEIADLGYRDSQIHEGWLAGNTISDVMDMYVDRVVGEEVFKYTGRQFPVSVKFVDAAGRMPLLVHPDDVIAGERYDFLGKAKMWYVVDADPGAKLYIGFANDADVTDFYDRCASGDLDGILNVVSPKAGDFFMIEPGTVNAASGGVLLLEISEASPMDFCLSTWGRESEDDGVDASLTLVEALDFINYGKYSASPVPSQDPGSQTRKLVQRNEFTVSEISLKDPEHIFNDEAGSFSIYTCVSGSATIQVPEGSGADNYEMKAGETVLVPAEIDDYFLVPRQAGTVLVETIMEERFDTDLYIDPSADEKLPEDE